MPLSELERAVSVTRMLRMTVMEAIKYLDGRGHSMSRRQYHRILARIDGKVLERLHEQAQGLRADHLERIEEIHLVRRSLWEQYNKANRADEPDMAARILKSIADLQPMLSAYMEATQPIMEEHVRLFGTEREETRREAVRHLPALAAP